MRTLPKGCLLHHAVVILFYSFFCVLSKRLSFIPNFIFITYNALILALSAVYLYSDFNMDIFMAKQTVPKMIRQIILGLGFAILLSGLFICVAIIFEDVSLFPCLQAALDAQDVVYLVFLQIIVALAEEAFFNYYLYDTIMFLFRGKVALSIMVVATAFSFAHWVLNCNLKQAVVAFVFRLAALFIRRKLYEDNTFYICSSMHFFYNLMAFFVFSI